MIANLFYKTFSILTDQTIERKRKSFGTTDGFLTFRVCRMTFRVLLN